MFLLLLVSYHIRCASNNVRQPATTTMCLPTEAFSLFLSLIQNNHIRKLANNASVLNAELMMGREVWRIRNCNKNTGEMKGCAIFAFALAGDHSIPLAGRNSAHDPTFILPDSLSTYLFGCS
jgi:hypothetical protein